MIKMLFKRTLASIPVLLVVTLVVFLLLQVSSGDPAIVLAGDFATPEQIESIRNRLGLDKPIWQQYLIWLWQILQGDLGTSIFSRLPVTELFYQRLEPTIALTLSSILLTVAVAVPLGVVAAWRSGTLLDNTIMLFSVLGFSLPVFVVGYLLVYVFSVKLSWLPSQGYISPFDDPSGFLASMVLPTITLSIVFMALIARVTRASMLDVLSEDYIETARAKGASERRLLLNHALRNASVPILTVVGIALAALVSGVVITETIYNIPGLGSLVVDAILKRDYPVIQGMILIISVAYVAINLVIDLAYALIDPRIRY